jgi:ribonuclease HII
MFVPERVLTNFDFEKMVDTTNEWILERTGIKTRHVVEKGQANSDLAAGAIRRLCERRGITPEEIDRINILNASFLAMHRAIEQLNPQPQHLLIDGNRFKPYPDIPHTCVVKGDGKYEAIAAASILAKTYRDDYMNRLHEQYPMYDWNRNKGYPTKAHRAAIRQYGPTPYHRMSFQLLERQLSIF